MTNTIRSIRSTLNFLLAMLELFISICFTVKVFGSDSSNGALFEYILEILNMVGDSTTTFAKNIDIVGPISFLVLVLGGMLFSMALIKMIPQALGRERELGTVNRSYKYSGYNRKRFRKNRFFKF